MAGDVREATVWCPLSCYCRVAAYLPVVLFCGFCDSVAAVGPSAFHMVMNVDNHALALPLIINRLYLPSTWSLSERLGNTFAWKDCLCFLHEGLPRSHSLSLSLSHTLSSL